MFTAVLVVALMAWGIWTAGRANDNSMLSARHVCYPLSAVFGIVLVTEVIVPRYDFGEELTQLMKSVVLPTLGVTVFMMFSAAMLPRRSYDRIMFEVMRRRR